MLVLIYCNSVILLLSLFLNYHFLIKTAFTSSYMEIQEAYSDIF